MKPFSRRRYMALLMAQGPDWIKSNLLHPSPAMRRIHKLLHCVALRRMGETIPCLYRVDMS